VERGLACSVCVAGGAVGGFGRRREGAGVGLQVEDRLGIEGAGEGKGTTYLS